MNSQIANQVAEQNRKNWQDHWKGYITAMTGYQTPGTSLPAYQTSSSETGVTGFMDLMVRKPEIQAKYDAMQGSWEGVQASEAAISQGLFKTEAMPINQKNYGKK